MLNMFSFHPDQIRLCLEQVDTGKALESESHLSTYFFYKYQNRRQL